MPENPYQPPKEVGTAERGVTLKPQFQSRHLLGLILLIAACLVVFRIGVTIDFWDPLSHPLYAAGYTLAAFLAVGLVGGMVLRHPLGGAIVGAVIGMSGASSVFVRMVMIQSQV